MKVRVLFVSILSLVSGFAHAATPEYLCSVTSGFYPQGSASVQYPTQNAVRVLQNAQPTEVKIAPSLSVQIQFSAMTTGSNQQGEGLALILQTEKTHSSSATFSSGKLGRELGLHEARDGYTIDLNCVRQ